MKYLLAIFFLVVFFFSSSVWAEEEKTPIICHGDTVVFLEDSQRLKASGNVIVIYEDVRITCDAINIGLENRQGLAEGDVVVYQKDSVLTGEKVEYDFDSQTGTIYQAGFASQLIYGQGPQAVKEGPKEISMHKSYMSTCDLAKPHYRIQAKAAKIFLDEKVVIKHAVVYAFDLPLFYLPSYSYTLKPDRPKVTVLPGKDKDWGYFLLTAWRYELNNYLKGVLRLDYREKKDLASGFDNYYSTDKFGKGFVKTYYMNERSLEGKHFWKQPRITHERERYVVQNRHSWDIDKNTDLRFQYWNVSDTDVLKDYFYHDEYEREQNDTTSYLSITRTMPEYNASLYLQRRFNKVFERLEYQPQLQLNIPSIRIGSEALKLYWRSDNSFDNLSKKFAYPSDVDEDTVRFDTFNQLSRPSQFGFLYFTPYLGERLTLYTKNKDGEKGDWWRHAFYAGAGIETKFYRIFDVSTNKWGLDINNLRHVITPSVHYDYVREPTIASDRLVQFDGLDSISRLNQISFSLENKLQTKRKVSDEDGQRYAAVDLARFTISTAYDYRLPSGSKFSNINFDFEFTPFNWMGVECDASYDHLQNKFTNFNLDIYANQQDKFKCGFGYRYAQESHSEATFEISFKPTPLWKLGVYERFMLKGYPNSVKKINDLRVQEYRIVRDLHCWTSEIIYSVSRGEGESLYFVFRLKSFPEMPLEFGTSYHRPKAGSQNPVR